MANKRELEERLKQLEEQGTGEKDKWWREMCERYGFPIVPINEATQEQKDAVMDKYMDDFY